MLSAISNLPLRQRLRTLLWLVNSLFWCLLGQYYLTNLPHFPVDAAIFYRAVDHGLRVSTGRTEGDLPSAPSQLANLTELVCRWTPEHLHDQPLDVELAQIKTRTREYFDRLFGT